MSSIIEAVRQIVTEHQIFVHENNERLHLSKKDLSTMINIEKLDDDSAFIYLVHRTTSWQLPGERTDAHDIYSVLLATYLRLCPNAFSSILWDVFNPAVPVPKTEVYARILMLEQPHHSIIYRDKDSLAELVTLFDYICEFELLFPHFFSWKRRNEQEFSFYGEVDRWAEHVAQVTGEATKGKKVYDDKNIQYNQRWGPDWLYYRSIRKNITVVESPPTVLALSLLIKDTGFQKDITGIKRHLYISSRVRSAVSFQAEKLGRKILRHLNGSKPKHMITIPLENKVLFAKGKYFVVLSRFCNLKEFHKEVQQIEQRHRKEAMLLFPANRFVWNTKIDDDRFELLIRELLAHEPGVVRVRKVGKSRDPDRGKDLIADWFTPFPAESLIPQDTSPLVFRKVLVQVKASSKSVNKNAVKDIRDIMDDHKASGYFLAVSSQITSNLTDYLDRMRSDGRLWAEWWNRIEIEERLNAHPEISAKYHDLVRRIE